MTEPLVEETLTRIASAQPVLLNGVDVDNLGGDTGGDPGEPPPQPVETPEPVYDRAIRRDIQGNIVPGFNKDHQHFLFYRFRDSGAARQWVAAVAPMVTSLDEVLEFVKLHRARRLARGWRSRPG